MKPQTQKPKEERFERVIEYEWDSDKKHHLLSFGISAVLMGIIFLCVDLWNHFTDNFWLALPIGILLIIIDSVYHYLMYRKITWRKIK